MFYYVYGLMSEIKNYYYYYNKTPIQNGQTKEDQ